MLGAPTPQADAADRDHGVGHAEIADTGLREKVETIWLIMPKPGRIRMYTSGWPKNQNRCWNSTGSPPPSAGEERSAEIAVGQQHGDGARQHRQRQQQQKHGDQDRPHEQRHLVQRHARRAHVEDGGDEVDGAEDRGRAREMQRENGESTADPGGPRSRSGAYMVQPAPTPLRRARLDEGGE